MLDNPIITAFLPTVKPKRSKQFYLDTLGLQLVSEDNFAIEFEGGGVFLRITTVEKFVPHPFTVLGFKIKDISSQVKRLITKGVEFKRYDSLGQDELGIWTSPGGAKVVWFEDPDGNLLSLTEYPN